MFFQNSLFWSYEWNASFLGICDTAAVFSVCFSEQQSKEQHEGNWNAGTIDPLHWPSHHRCPDSPHPLDSSDDTTFKDLTNRNWWTRDAWSPFTARGRRGSLCKKAGPWNNFTQANYGIFDFTWDKGHDILVAGNTRSWLLIPTHYRNINWYHYTIRTCVLF